MSRKNVTDEGWEHLEILLRPNPYDSTFKDLIIDEGVSFPKLELPIILLFL